MAKKRQPRRKKKKPTPLAERRLISNPPDWWDAFDDAAALNNVSLAYWVGEACKKQLPAAVRNKLSAREPRGRRPKWTKKPKS